MQKFAKRQRRAFRQTMRGVRERIAERSPPWARRALGPLVNHLDMLLIDHGVFRMVYVNRHRLGADAWRSAQPAPHHIRALGREGIRTIVNLRGSRVCGSYWLEQQACAAAGITLVNYQVRSRAAPTKEELRGARELFARIEYPMLMHCKSGADRVGLMSVLYRHVREGVPIEEARRELSAKFGHFSAADTGILDFVFDRYLADAKQRPMAFFDWVETVYDPDELKRVFKANSWANLLTNRILRRE
jgi:protein tyrosine/serine phosphatase